MIDTSVEGMKMVNILGPFAELNKLISVCIDSGCFHLENSSNATSGFRGFTGINEENPYASKLRKMIEVLDYCKLEPSLCCSDGTGLHENEIDRVLLALEDSLHELQTDREEYLKKIEFSEKMITNFSHFVGLNLNLNSARNSEFVRVKFGKIPYEEIEKLKEYAANNPYIIFTPFSKDETFYWGIYLTPLEYEDEVDRVFASLFFEQIQLPNGFESPEEIIEENKKELERLTEKLNKTEDTIDWYFNKHGDDFIRLYTQIKRDYDIFEYRRYASRYKKNFVMLLGWVPISDMHRFEDMIKKIGKFSIVEIKQDDQNNAEAKESLTAGMSPPTKLKNFKFIRPFQFFVDIYGIPGYREVDPTAFLAITYTLLYGIMFADVGQGLLLALIGYWMYKYKKIELGKPLIPCGIAGSLFGLVFGSVFGYEHVLNPLYRLLGFEEKPIEVMASATILLALSIVIGMVLIILAMITGIVASVKRGNIGLALFGSNGGAGLLFYISAIASVAIVLLKLDIPILPILIFGVILPVILIFIHQPLCSLVAGNGFKVESVGEFLIEGFFETFEVLLSYFTNTVSFLRVGAFVLIHAGMMMTFSSLAEIVGGGIAGVCMMVFGNIFVIALEGLLVGIQVLRLEFYEMFSRYFNGDGHPFIPIKIKARP